MKSPKIILLISVILVGCSIPMNSSEISQDAQKNIFSTPGMTTSSKSNETGDQIIDMSSCNLKPIKIPKLPKNIPGYTQLDEATGLHVTGSPIVVDFKSYLFKVTGLVDNPLTLTYDELRCMPKISSNAELVCPGFFVDVANWSGVPIKYLIELAGINPTAQQIILVSADGYERNIDLDQALAEENIIAYEWEGQPLPVLHGFPLRAVIPSMDGSFWVKWLVEIRVE